jgi:hypothetical protein
MKPTNIQIRVEIVFIFIFVATLIIGGLLFLASPKKHVSAAEKRTLASAPQFSVTNFFNGKFADQSEAYYNDNFILRDVWLDIADEIKALRGWQKSDGIQLVGNDGASDAKQPAVGADPEMAESAPVPIDAEYQRVKALIISKGRAIQIFGGTKTTVKPFADLVNSYHAVLGPSVKVYVMPIPSGSDFFIPREVFNGALHERKNFQDFYAMLAPGIIRVPAYESIAPHTADYIWMKTDHHWTGLGAYYAYRAFAKSAGFAPLPLDKLTHKQLPKPFLGSLYYRTRSESLANNPDTLHYYMIPNKTRAHIIPTGMDGGKPGQLYYEKTGGGNSYGVFLGGDHPLMRIETGIKNGRKIVVIKDSYGNAFVPYLAAHYEEVWVVDYRYFKGSIPELVKRHGIHEFLYAHNSFAMNTMGTVHFGRAMLGR